MTIEISANAAVGLFTLLVSTQKCKQIHGSTWHGTWLDFHVYLHSITGVAVVAVSAASGINDAYYDKSCYNNSSNKNWMKT